MTHAMRRDAEARLVDLPPNVVRRVLQLRYPHVIAGTSNALAVCRSWRDAARDSEPFSLLCLADELNEQQQLDAVSSWLKTHTTALLGLELRNTLVGFESQPLNAWPPELSAALQQGLVAVPARLQQPLPYQQLTSLCVDGATSLLLVAPLLPKLPQLLHLEAGMAIAKSDGGQFEGVFSTDDGQPLEQLPIVTFPTNFTSLRLNLDVPPDMWGALVSTDRPKLLPTTLQQLHLAANEGGVLLLDESITHLISLRTLQLGHAKVDDWQLLLSMSSLREVAIYDPRVNLYDASFTDWCADALSAGAAPLLVAAPFSSSSQLRSYGDVLTQLRSLHLYGRWDVGFTAANLRPLQGLTQLQLEDMYAPVLASLATCLTGCRGLSQLRALHIDFSIDLDQEEDEA